MERFFMMSRNNNESSIDIKKFYEEEQKRFELDYSNAEDQERQEDEIIRAREEIGSTKAK